MHGIPAHQGDISHSDVLVSPIAKRRGIISRTFRGLTFRLTLAVFLIISFFLHIGIAFSLYRLHIYNLSNLARHVEETCSFHSRDIEQRLVSAVRQPPMEREKAMGRIYDAILKTTPHPVEYFSVSMANDPGQPLFHRGLDIQWKDLRRPGQALPDGEQRKLTLGSRIAIVSVKPLFSDGQRRHAIAFWGIGGSDLTYTRLLIKYALDNRMLMLYGGTVSFIVLFVLVLFMTSSIRSAVRHIGAIEDGDYKHRIPVKAHDEGGEVAEAFNRMAFRLNNVYVATLGALAALLETKDRNTETHSMRVVKYAMELGLAYGLSQQDISDLEYGALLHDIGKVGVDDGILRKAGPLSEAEWETIRQHPSIGYGVLKDVDFLRNALPVILHHQERFDGRGYPNGLKGDQIPILARLFTIADSYEAMISDRPYRKAMKPEHAISEIRRNAGTQFDPRLVDIFVKLYEEGKLDPAVSVSSEIRIASQTA